MRWSWVLVGVAAIVIGAALLFVAVVPQGEQTVTYSTSNSTTLPYYEASITGYSLTGTIVILVSWTAAQSADVQVVAAACSAACNGDINRYSDLTNQTGTSGSFTLDQPNGGSIIFGILSTANGSDASVTFKVTTALSTVGSALVVVGVILVVVGVVLRSGPRRAVAPTQPTESPASQSPGTLGGEASPPT
jgi:hypothetical protein